MEKKVALSESIKEKQMSEELTPFNKVFLTGKEGEYFEDVLARKELACNGKYTQKVHTWLEKTLGAKAAFLTGAGTQALEMSALLLGVEPGDEIIMPSFTFVTTASAFVRAGAVPVFVDIKNDSLNIDVEEVEKAITSKTKAIVPVHYAGVGCEMHRLLELAKNQNLPVMEDAAHGILAKYKDSYLGTIGHMGVLSFHETKNIVGGEGGALLVNDEKYIARARQIWHKGTNKHEMELGLVGRYTWTELGSAFAASEITAAVIFAQLERAPEIVSLRKQAWERYHALLGDLELKGYLTRPHVPEHCQQNGHIYYFLNSNKETRDGLIKHLRKDNIESVFHYIPLHSSPAGKRYGKHIGSLAVTDSVSDRLLRLPLWPDLTIEIQERIVASIEKFFKAK